MADLINFESSFNKSLKREDIRKQRCRILQDAKAEYEKKERQKAEARDRGEDTWMLQSVSQRVSMEQEDFEKSKKKLKKKKRKKDKKKKKSRKRKSCSSSDSESNSQPEWVEKITGDEAAPKLGGLVKGPKMERESWMMADFAAIGGESRAELKAKKLAEEEEEKKQLQNMMDKPGQHERELNPYWKSGGTGLPEERPSTSISLRPAKVSGDGGVEWLRKALVRCKQQAEDEGRSLEEVAAERYGSLKKLKSMLRNAEERFAQTQSQVDTRTYRRDKEKIYPTKKGDMNKKYDRHGRRSGSSGSSSDRSDSYKEKNKSHFNNRGQNRSHSRDRGYSRQKSSEREHHSRYKLSRSRSRSSSEDRELDSKYERRNREYKSKLGNNGDNSSRLKALSGRFKKPGNDSDGEEKYSSSRADKKSANSKPSWKKKGFIKPGDSENSNIDRTESVKGAGEKASSNRTAVKSSEKKYAVDTDRRIRKEVESRSSSSSSSSDSDTSTDSDADRPDTKPSVKTTVKPLTEQEINQLGAKMVKAEIMGQTALAEKLKLQIEEARKALANPTASTSSTKESQDEEHVVVLTKMNKQGMVRPLAEREHPTEPNKGRRKRQKIETHAGDKGDRARYFHDDDKFNLKQMVEQERLGTAEDSNMMFARLAGRSMDKTTDDYQLDDVLLDRASKKVSDSRTEDRERSKAIFEHRKISEAMEKCHFCFNKVPKHLIIAIGVKCYLALPNHKSLSEGHCLIIPMQHVSQGTVLDEDVWDEVQVFRKGLTKMFEEKEEDCVFMEMSRGLRHHPHMVLECVPMPREVGDLAPIYFKKAIQECESEWSDNKKVVDLSGRDVRRAIPKGFPYFSVDFGLQGGFAHVIEDEKEFPYYFGREVIGGMLDVGPELWRKPHKENFEEQRKKVLQFSECWKPYDWTMKLKSKTDDN